MNTQTRDCGETRHVQNSKPAYVTVFLIPIVGGNGNIQSRSLVFSKPPTKEHAIETLRGIHEDNKGKSNYSNEWTRCVDTLQQVPEELFARMNQRRTRNITHLIDVQMDGGHVQQRLFSARSCYVHGGDALILP